MAAVVDNDDDDTVLEDDILGVEERSGVEGRVRGYGDTSRDDRGDRCTRDDAGWLGRVEGAYVRKEVKEWSRAEGYLLRSPHDGLSEPMSLGQQQFLHCVSFPYPLLSPLTLNIPRSEDITVLFISFYRPRNFTLFYRFLIATRGDTGLHNFGPFLVARTTKASRLL